MKKAVRSHREVLSPKIAEALLAMPGGDGVSLGVRLQQATEALRAVVAEANTALAASPIMPIVARDAARQIGRRGDAIVVVDPDGAVMLEFGQGVEAVEDDKREWTTQFPSLHALRAAAAKLGIDTAPMGRSKKQIVAALRAAKKDAPAASKKMTRTAPAITPPVVVTLDEGKVVPTPKPADHGTVDLTGFDDDPPPTKPAGVHAVEDARVGAVLDSVAKPKKTFGGKTLSQLAGDADGVNLDALFAAPPPPIPSE